MTAPLLFAGRQVPVWWVVSATANYRTAKGGFENGQ
jgi:hypothetical protein